MYWCSILFFCSSVLWRVANSKPWQQNLQSAQDTKIFILNRLKFEKINYLDKHLSHTCQIYVTFTKASCQKNLCFGSFLSFKLSTISLETCIFYSKMHILHIGKTITEVSCEYFKFYWIFLSTSTQMISKIS